MGAHRRRNRIIALGSTNLLQRKSEIDRSKQKAKPRENYKAEMAKIQSKLQNILLRSSYVQYVLGYLVTSVSIVSQVRYSGTWLVKASELTAKFGS